MIWRSDPNFSDAICCKTRCYTFAMKLGFFWFSTLSIGRFEATLMGTKPDDLQRFTKENYLKR